MKRDTLPYLFDHAADLVGRESELAAVCRFLRAAGRAGGSSLLLWGDAGVGKTALLSAAGRIAVDDGFRLLFAQGTEFEAEISYSGLQQLLLPVWREVEQAPAHHLEALRVALGLAVAEPPPIDLVVAATTRVLSGIARDQPVLVAADDIHWLDRATARVLADVARRPFTDRARIGFVSTTRADHAAGDEVAATALHVGPLTDTASESLLNASFPDLDRDLRRRVLSVAHGNPLALVELARSSASSLPDEFDVAPLSSRLLRTFGSRLETLDSSTRWLMLVAALDGGGSATAVMAVSPDNNVTGHLQRAAQVGIAHWEDGRGILFRHPLTARVVVQQATRAEVRDANRALGEFYLRRPDGLERAAWHLAEAAMSSDDEVADLLEDAARTTLGRGDALTAAELLVRAASLSETNAGRTRRIAQAAWLGSEVTGNLSAAAEMLAAARVADPGYRTSLAAASAAASALLNGDGEVDTAHRLLVAAVENYAHREAADDRVLIDALTTLNMLCWYGGREELWTPYRAAVERLRPAPPPLLYLCTHTYPDPARVTAGVLTVLSGQIDTLTTQGDPAAVISTAMSSYYFDRLGDCRAALSRVADDGRHGGAVASSINAMYMMGNDDFMHGCWARCQTLATEALDLADRHGYKLIAFSGHYLLARLAAVKGDDDELADRLSRMEQWAVPRGIRSTAMFTLHIRVLAASGRADFPAAYRHAAALSPPGTFAAFVPLAPLVCYELIEAAMRTGRGEQARAHAVAVERAGLAMWSSRWELVAAACAALAADTAQSIEHLSALLKQEEAACWPFDRARGQLVVGAYLRRHNAVAESRGHLSAAENTFTELGAAPWARRAGEELAATAAIRQPGHDGGFAVLTPQQREIAELAARGMSNKQIAQRLNISPRTVGNHLYQVFPKLGVRSRAGLRDALNGFKK
jgi:DNA-binding CsgD family transcriptional regulator